MKIVKLTSLLPEMPRLSSPWHRYDRQHPHLSPKSVYSLLRSVAVSSSTSSSSPNFSNCSSPRELALVFADYLRSHFSLSQPRALCSKARGCQFEICRATCPQESHCYFWSLFSPPVFLAASFNLSSFSATGPERVAYPILKHLPHSGMDFLVTFSIFPGLCIPFLLQYIFYYYHQ